MFAQRFVSALGFGLKTKKIKVNSTIVFIRSRRNGTEERRTVKCKICSREAEASGFCSLHLMAYRNIMEKYTVWQKAVKIEWGEYLVQIQKNSLTGEWAKEVVKNIITGEHIDVGKNKKTL
ncbi:MAG: hypothetical protein LBI79_09530 [Nitrososphaerota archaeon]|nr:hypothetical protein [Nitrososphaerota archaeon]